MKRNLKSLNEQISRMKSLFTEERLYGNLVENEDVITEGELLKVGSKGDGVKGLQELLGITIDGIFGDETKKSLMGFQSKNGLKADGVAGPKTLEKLMVSVVKPTNESINLHEDDISALNLVSKTIVNQEVVDDQGKPLPDSDFVKNTSFWMNQDKIDNPNKQPEEIKIDKQNTERLERDTLIKMDNKQPEVGGEEKKIDNKQPEVGGEEKKGTYDNQNKGSEEEGEDKAGTNIKGDTYSKGERKDVVKGVLASVKQSAGEIDDNIKKCKQGIKQLYIQIKKVGNVGLDKLTEEELKNLDWCVGTFKNRFSKLGFGVDIKQVDQIYNQLNREVPELSNDGVEGEKYDVLDNGGLKIAMVKRVGPGKYRFNGKKGYLIAKKNSKTGNYVMNSKYNDYFLKALNLKPEEKTIVIINSDGNNGTFTIR